MVKLIRSQIDSNRNQIPDTERHRVDHLSSMANNLLHSALYFICLPSLPARASSIINFFLSRRPQRSSFPLSLSFSLTFSLPLLHNVMSLCSASPPSPFSPPRDSSLYIDSSRGCLNSSARPCIGNVISEHRLPFRESWMRHASASRDSSHDPVYQNFSVHLPL